ncbi:hypothetical protein ASG60_20740 [Methylobacterium sp. Leaf469]|uniref:hypothetical protein n=1 Tax=Methylobacterium sp. Leaf469 TaxID=1736387 RepID=UPI0006F48252|nr:hypothetical protein [Methylobacterium sp. Leaf469]KQT96064.1 hypothetical protein ASG60_20740 [Methylobacterium sp. Leaf469]
MSRLAQFRALLTRARQDAPAPAPQLANDRDAAADELVAAQTGVEDAEAAYQGALLGATDEGLRKLDEDRRAATIRLDRARMLVDRFAAQTAAAVEAKDRAALAAIVETATAAQSAFREAVERDLPDMAARARAILALRVEAERATVAANRALADAGEGGPLPGVEAFRVLPGRPREELRRETVEKWVDEAGVAAGHQEKIVTRGDGSGSLMLPNAHHLRVYSRKRLFEVVEFLPAERGAKPASLVDALYVPDVYGVARQGADRRPQTETRPVGPARVVAKVEPSRAERMAMGQRA